MKFDQRVVKLVMKRKLEKIIMPVLILVAMFLIMISFIWEKKIGGE